MLVNKGENEETFIFQENSPGICVTSLLMSLAEKVVSLGTN